MIGKDGLLRIAPERVLGQHPDASMIAVGGHREPLGGLRLPWLAVKRDELLAERLFRIRNL
jgi:hypothetical protein